MAKSTASDKNAHRLRTFLLLLSSDKDGEVVAAARAISNLLQRENKTWHDLAENITGKAITAPKAKSQPRQPRPSQPKPGPHSYYTGGEKRYTTDDDTFRKLLNAKLNDWEREFVQSVYVQWKRKRYISEKQKSVLERICDCVGI